MSSVSISYRDLKDASSDASKVAKKLDSYADELEKTVFNKLKKYNGKWTDNLADAYNSTNKKINSIREIQHSYETYSSDLSGLRDECKRVDKGVLDKISTLTADFKKANGIRNSNVENCLNYFGVSLVNSSSGGRWVNDKLDDVERVYNGIRDEIKKWYNFEGGKEFLKGAAIAILDIAIAACTIVATILSGGSILLIIGACIALAGGIVNYCNEWNALVAATSDPALAYRMRNINSVQDWLRKGDLTDEHDTGWFNQSVKERRKLAFAIDLVKLICDLYKFGKDIGDFTKSFAAWANAKPDASWTDFFSKDTFKNAWANKGDIWNSIKSNFSGSLLQNLTKNFGNFSTGEARAKTVSNYLKITKDLVSGKNIFEVAFERLLLPNLTLIQATTIDSGAKLPDGLPNLFSSSDDFAKFKFSNIVPKDVIDIGSDFMEKIIGSDSWNSNSNYGNWDFNNLTIDKLSTPSNISVSIPDIVVPTITMPALTV